jgi:hypothetical protein
MKRNATTIIVAAGLLASIAIAGISAYAAMSGAPPSQETRVAMATIAYCDPAAAPKAEGDLWVNRVSRQVWVSTGHASIKDWTRMQHAQ